MLENTFKLLEGIPAGTFVPDDKRCYDEGEIAALAQTLNRLLYAPSQVRKKLQDLGVTVTPANFYSEIPLIREVENPAFSSTDFSAGFENDTMLRFLAALDVYAAEFTPPLKVDDPHWGATPSYAWEGGPFSYSDAMAYYAVIRKLKPRRIVEVGSGWSTLVAQAACAWNGFGDIYCIEPYPPEFLEQVSGVVKVIRKPVQEIGADFFNDTLQDGDLFFIDSTHTVKHGSDCLHLYLKILPNIDRNILVHAHDIYLPGSMPVAMARDQQIYWTEQYLLYAYLLENSRTKILYGSSYHYRKNPELLKSFMHGRYGEGGASFWFSQSRRGSTPHWLDY